MGTSILNYEFYRESYARPKFRASQFSVNEFVDSPRVRRGQCRGPIQSRFLPGAPGLALFETWDSTVASISGFCRVAQLPHCQFVQSSQRIRIPAH
jgi:hypothetical protein